MAVLWVIFEFAIIVCYYELPEIHKQIQQDFLDAQIRESYDGPNVSGFMEPSLTPSQSGANILSRDLSPSQPAAEITPRDSDTQSTDTSSATSSPNKSPLKRFPPSSGRGRSVRSSAASRSSSEQDLIFTSSNEMIESAERFMGTPEIPQNQADPYELHFESGHFAAPPRPTRITTYPIPEEGSIHQSRDSPYHQQNGELPSTHTRTQCDNDSAQSANHSQILNSRTHSKLWTCAFYYNGKDSKEFFFICKALDNVNSFKSLTLM